MLTVAKGSLTFGGNSWLRVRNAVPRLFSSKNGALCYLFQPILSLHYNLSLMPLHTFRMHTQYRKITSYNIRLAY